MREGQEIGKASETEEKEGNENALGGLWEISSATTPNGNGYIRVDLKPERRVSPPAEFNFDVLRGPSLPLAAHPGARR